MGLQFEKKPEPTRVAFNCPPDMRKHVTDVFQGEYDVPLEDVATCLDLGANYGSFSVWAMHRWPSCTIEAYEPVERVFAGLAKNVESYASRIRCHNLAVRDFVGERQMVLGANNSGEASFFIDGSDTVRVQVVDAGSLGPADFVKIDTEGCELEIVKNYPHWDKVRAVAYEWHRRIDRWLLGAFFADHGFYMVHEKIITNPNTPEVRYGDVGVAKWMKE